MCYFFSLFQAGRQSMRVKQIISRKPGEPSGQLAELQAIEPDLLLLFGAVEHFTVAPLYETLRQAFPEVHLPGCSTAGEITQDGVDDGMCTVTPVASCKLHKQTMSINYLGEV